MSDGPDFERVADVLGTIVLRYLEAKNRADPREGNDVDGGLLPSLDRRASGRGVLDRRAISEADRLRRPA